ncbi:hypothetical protein PG994_005584 [Apiospora phragmitis]|uniref:Uncharacterized protein n=1 Tax=Apiospora phragmitis TaxID=2905665 RepID=A0ABR1VCN3_9PEZI
MAATKTDFQVASLAAGFSLGFGFLTAWEAIKQTRRNKNPARSAYIYMVWCEIAVNIVIAVLGWLFLDGVLKPTVPVLFFILFCWVFEIQLLMQIIINRIAIIAESQATVRKIKYGTIVIITLVNASVFVIWIPAHLETPRAKCKSNSIFIRWVTINKYWDPISKVLILIVDAGLNWYFVRSVKERLVNQHGLVKYAPLVGFNTKLLVVSILMDVSVPSTFPLIKTDGRTNPTSKAFLIGLMFLPNPVVYIQFHPVTYLTKLNIEMSVANLIARLARGGSHSDQFHSSSYNNTGPRTHNARNNPQFGNEQDLALKSFTKSRIRSGAGGDDDDSDDNGGGSPMGGIHKRLEYEVTVHHNPPGSKPPSSSQSHSFELTKDDEMALTQHAGHPRNTEL